MDVIKKEHDSDETTSQISSLKAEQVVAIKYEEYYDLNPFPVIVNKEKVSSISFMFCLNCVDI
jgi:hypothetical protein